MIFNATLHRLQESDHLDADRINIHRLSPETGSFHGHNFFELVYVMQGSAVHHLGQRTHELFQGDYFIMDLDSFHCYQETRDFIIVNCLFAPEYVDRALVNCPSLSALLSNEMRQFGLQTGNAADRPYRDDSGEIRRLIESMEREYAQRQGGYQEMIRCHLIEILVRTARLASESADIAPIHPAVAAMAEHLRTHYAQPLSLNAISTVLGYTPQYLSHLFHRETGTSLSVFLQKLRVEKSCRMLLESRMNVSAIAQEVGYSDLKHFNSVFKRHMGLSPRAFRARASAGHSS